MKKTLSLLGLLLVGLILLANPTTGVFGETETQSDVAASVATTAMSGDPPDESEAEDDVVMSAAETTTTLETTTTELAVENESSESFSVVGSSEQSRFGTFQVEVFFEDGEIVAVDALSLPNDNKSDAINDRALPVYEAEIIESQSADIDVVSGATVTWENYTASVQSALDEAGFVG